MACLGVFRPDLGSKTSWNDRRWLAHPTSFLQWIRTACSMWDIFLDQDRPCWARTFVGWPRSSWHLPPTFAWTDPSGTSCRRRWRCLALFWVFWQFWGDPAIVWPQTWEERRSMGASLRAELLACSQRMFHHFLRQSLGGWCKSSKLMPSLFETVFEDPRLEFMPCSISWAFLWRYQQKHP